jgi:hypothetical protein
MSSSSSESESNPAAEAAIAIMFVVLLFSAVIVFLVVIFLIAYILDEIISVYRVHGKPDQPGARDLRRAWQKLLGVLLASALVWIAGNVELAVLMIGMAATCYVIYVFRMGAKLDPPKVEPVPIEEVDSAEIDSYLRPFGARGDTVLPIAAPPPEIPVVVRSRTSLDEAIGKIRLRDRKPQSPDVKNPSFQDVQALLQA